MTAALVLVARACGAGRADLGLLRSDAGRGLRYGGAAAGIVLVVLGSAALLPVTSGACATHAAPSAPVGSAYELVVRSSC